jgi:serine/threonine protein kinase/tetratricopeptide (TPR) repeat protein
MHSSDLSLDPPAIRALTLEQQQRLTDVLDRYLLTLDDGVPPRPDALIAAHPDLAEPLRVYLQSLDHMHGMATGFRDLSDQTVDHEAAAGFDRVRLGDFVLGREIGRGGMGVVYEARQLSLNRRVALKVLPFAAVFDTKQIARFKNEAQAAAQLHHPHIVPIYAVGMDRGVHYYAMQFIEGQSLDKAIAQLRREEASAACRAAISVLGQAQIPTAPDDSPATCRSFLTERTASRDTYFDTVLRLGIQAAEALHAAHECGVVHRDIKPSNLLLNSDGELWITDFGLARFRSDGTLTQSGDVVGTMRYMSPEQASGDTALVDHRTDIYSLAVTLYELITLQPAIAGEAAADLLRAIDQQEPPRLRGISPDIPKDLETVVRKGMAKFREERYATARQFADDLRHVLAGEPTVAKPPTLQERAGKWMRGHKRLVGTAACVCLLAGAGGALSTLLIARESVKADRNYQRAEENFRAARDVVDHFGSRLAERLADIPGASHVRHELLTETIQYYRDFIDQAQGDPGLRADLALTYSKIATLLDERGSANEAIDAFDTASSMYTRLVADEPGVREHRRHLALCWNNLARALARRGRIDEAREAHGAAIVIQEQLVQDADDAQCISDLALSHSNLGLLQADTDETAVADKSFHDAIRLQEQLTNRNPNEPEYRRNLAASYNNLGGLYARQDPQRAMESFLVAITHQAQAATAQPDNPTYQDDLALTYCNLGSAQSRVGCCRDAAAAYAQAIELQTDLVQAAPAQRSYRRNLAISHNNLGLMQSGLGQASLAEESFRKALELQEVLVSQNPGDVALQSGLAGVYNNCGIVLEGLERTEQAATAYQHAVDHQRIAYSHAPSVERYRSFLSKHYYNYGRVLRKLGRAEPASQVALVRRDLWPHNPQHLLAVAEELALASNLLTDEPGSDLTKKQCVTLAIDTLQQAVAAGLVLPNGFGKNEAFAAIKDSKRFAELVGK